MEEFDKIKSNGYVKAFHQNVLHEDSVIVIEEKLDHLRKISKLELEYSVLHPKRFDRLEVIKRMALDRVAPFSLASDKGFKDTYIYFTVIDFLEETNDDVYVMTRDDRLCEALKSTSAHPIRNLSDYFTRRTSYFYEAYFMSTLREYFMMEQGDECTILNIKTNSEGNWIITATHNEDIQEIEVDYLSREILDDG